MKPLSRLESNNMGLNKHTPTPWKVTQGGLFIEPSKWKVLTNIAICNSSVLSKEENDANAQLIVKCVNNHEALIDATEDALSFLSQEAECVIDEDLKTEYTRVIDLLSAVLTKSKEG